MSIDPKLGFDSHCKMKSGHTNWMDWTFEIVTLLGQAIEAQKALRSFTPIIVVRKSASPAVP